MTLQHSNTYPRTRCSGRDVLQEHGEGAAVIAGAPIAWRTQGRHPRCPPELLIGLKPLADLRYVNADAWGALGSLPRLPRCAAPVIRQTYPLLAEAAHSVAHADPQRRDHCGQPLPGAPLLVLPQPDNT